ncbi:helix-turn-helix domain-containing protein [Luteibacter yeojuensis]
MQPAAASAQPSSAPRSAVTNDLTEWRMRLAERALREENTPVALVGQALGYTSESAFSNAFKRMTGHSPKAYRNTSRLPGQ